MIDALCLRSIPRLRAQADSVSPPFNDRPSFFLNRAGRQEQEQENIHRDSDCREARVEA
jgi:hypothetical protein